MPWLPIDRNGVSIRAPREGGDLWSIASLFLKS